MMGMDVKTGKLIEGEEFLKQSIQLILGTAKGSLTMMRDFGSSLYELIDEPIDGKFSLRLNSKTVEALAKWIPSVSVENTELSIDQGKVMYSLSGQASGTNYHVEVSGLGHD